MGIQGLLPMLKEVQTPTHITHWRGKTLAVDSYVWLHRGAYGCAEDLALGKKTVQYVNYAMHRVRLLKYHNVTPIMVFDGGLLPSKMGTEGGRENRRKDALLKGHQLLAEGKKSQARDAFVKAVDVTPEMAFQLIKALRREGVQYIVAPYEADPQLAYLERQGIVDGIITEDSDLLVFGCKNVLFKLDGDGNCIHLERDQFTRCREHNFSGWTDKEFRQMAILSGCDYLDSIVGIGLKTAHGLMRKYKTAEKVIQYIRISGNHTVPRDYPDQFKRAELTFAHQRVFDPVNKCLVHLEPLPAGMTGDDVPFVGADMDDTFVRGLANGDIDPLSRLPMVDINPDVFSPSATYKPPPFKPTKAKSSSSTLTKKVIGAGSILNFFKKQASTSTSTPSISSRLVVTDVKGKKRDHAGNEVEPSGGIQSKFFGGGGLASTSRVVDEDEVEIVEEEEEDEFPDEEVMEYYEALEAQHDADYLEEDEDALAAMRDLSQKDHGTDSSTSTPPDLELQTLEELDEPFPSTKIRQSRSASIVSSLLAVSSPPNDNHPSSPPHKRIRLDSVLEDSGYASSSHDDGISSPPPTFNKFERSSPPLLSPTTTTRFSVFKSETSAVVNVEVPGGSESKKGKGKAKEFNSDPIELFSDSPMDDLDEDKKEKLDEEEEDEREEEEEMDTPKARKTLKERGGVGGKKSAVSKVKGTGPVGKVKKEKGSSSSGSSSSSPRVKQNVDEDEEVEVDESILKIAAGWRAQFMNPNFKGKTPPIKPPSSRKSLPTPASSGSRVPRPVALPPKSTTTTSSSSLKISTTSKTSSSIARAPLSPKKTNINASFSQQQQQVTKMAYSKSGSSDREDDITSSSSSPQVRERVVVTNEKLLQFRYRGPIV